jgi:hypothetical protein
MINGFALSGVVHLFVMGAKRLVTIAKARDISMVSGFAGCSLEVPLYVTYVVGYITVREPSHLEYACHHRVNRFFLSSSTHHHHFVRNSI